MCFFGALKTSSQTRWSQRPCIAPEEVVGQLHHSQARLHMDDPSLGVNLHYGRKFGLGNIAFGLQGQGVRLSQRFRFQVQILG